MQQKSYNLVVVQNLSQTTGTVCATRVRILRRFTTAYFLSSVT